MSIYSKSITCAEIYSTSGFTFHSSFCLNIVRSFAWNDRNSFEKWSASRWRVYRDSRDVNSRVHRFSSAFVLYLCKTTLNARSKMSMTMNITYIYEGFYFVYFFPLYLLLNLFRKNVESIFINRNGWYLFLAKPISIKFTANMNMNSSSDRFEFDECELIISIMTQFPIRMPSIWI